MATINFKIKYGINEGLIISPSELIQQYLFGIDMCTRDGRAMSNETIIQKILAAQRNLEIYLSIKLSRQIVVEDRDFMRGDYSEWGFLAVNYPVRGVIALKGFISTTKQIEFPIEWTSIGKSNNEDLVRRNIHIVPAGSTASTSTIVFVGISPNLGMLGVSSIPNYWNLKYVTGFNKIPDDLRQNISKMVAIELLGILGELIIQPGLTGQTLSYDGLSQALTTSKTGTTGGYGARIAQYAADLTRDMPQLRDYYKGIQFLAC